MPAKTTDLTTAVFEFIKANPGVTVKEIAEQLDKPCRGVKVAVSNLTAKEKIESDFTKRGVPARYTAAYQAPQMATPMNGPGHTMKPLGKLAAPTYSPLRNGTSTGIYDGAELRPYADRRNANDHMLHGRVEGGEWRPYTPPGLMCVGVVGPVAVSGTQRRFAA